MFTGIIEELGRVSKLETEGSNLHITIDSSLSKELKIDQSVAHNGVCLTVVHRTDSSYVVTAIKETLDKSNLGKLNVGDEVNLERCLQFGGRIDGHIVQGHVDGQGHVSSIENEEGSWKFTIEYPKENSRLIIPKGSITINGVSLTVVDPSPGEFSVAIIPYTYEHTTFKNFEIGSPVNLEFDMMGKYIAAHIAEMQL